MLLDFRLVAMTAVGSGEDPWLTSWLLVLARASGSMEVQYLQREWAAPASGDEPAEAAAAAAGSPVGGGTRGEVVRWLQAYSGPLWTFVSIEGVCLYKFIFQT